ncbi:MAG: MerR family transcriptional regulator [Deltaproteobacteria bacterium]|jgi:DNA-binding transcriptional MerR regulator|nr:MerR family transcriptional regulator [Deltaproteobacteria bacterium]
MYNIGKLAELAGTRAMTVRYYEKAGLLGKPMRRDNGYRRYSEKDLEILRFVRHCRSHGFTLDEIKDLLVLRDAPEASCGLVDEIVLRHIEKLDEELSSLNSLRDQLMELRSRCPPGGKVSECGIMRGLMDPARCPCGEMAENRSRPGLAAPLPEDGPDRPGNTEATGSGTGNPPEGSRRCRR